MSHRLRITPQLALPALLVFVTLLYLPTLSFGFAYDDLWQVPMFQNWDQVLTEYYYFRPVFNVSNWLAWSAWGINPLGYHLASLMLHIANVTLFFWVVRRLSGRIELAFAAGLIWNLLPSTPYPVAWLAQRNDLLCVSFLLLSTLALIRSLQERPRLWSTVSASFYGLALLSKEMAVPLIVVFLLALWWLRLEEGWLGALTRVLPHEAVLTAYFLARYWFTGFVIPPAWESTVSAYGSSLGPQVAVTALHYAEALIQHVLPIYEFPSWPIGVLFTFLAAVLGGLLLPQALHLLRSSGGIGKVYRAGLVWLAAFLVMAAVAWGHPRHLYVPSVGFASALAALLAACIEHPMHIQRKVILGISSLGLAVLSLVMVLQVQALFAEDSPQALDYSTCYVEAPSVITELYPYAQAQLARHATDARCRFGGDTYWERLTVNELFQLKRTELRPRLAALLSGWLQR